MRANTSNHAEGARAHEVTAMIQETEGPVSPSRPEQTAGEIGCGANGQATALRSTGINGEARKPIDPSSPNLSPA